MLLAGIALLSHAYQIGATDPEKQATRASSLSVAGAVVGRGPFYYVTIGSTLAVLALSANTSFAGFPRLCRLLAEDDYLPLMPSNKGRRLVYSAGIAILRRSPRRS